MRAPARAAILACTLVAGRAAAQTPDPRDWPGDEEAKSDFQQSRPVPDASPAHVRGRFGAAELYGAGEFDWIHDSSQSFGAATTNTLARPGTAFGDESQNQTTACDSRVGLRLGTPEDRRVRGIFLVEAGPDLWMKQGDTSNCYRLHVRHLYVALRSPIVDVLVGRYYGLFGWGGRGFFPNTAAFLGVPGQIYHRERQVRVSHIFRFAPVDFEIAGALARSDGDPDGGELHLAARLAANRWRGASAQGAGQPAAVPMQIGVSVVGRSLQVNDFSATPRERLTATGHGIALDAFVPAIPVYGDDLSNALSFTLELAQTSGLADVYPGVMGNLYLPALPNPNDALAPPVYVLTVPRGVATFDASGNLRLIEWRTFVVGAQYHLPFARGRRVWLSSTFSAVHSPNAASLTPPTASPFTWSRGSYFDANAFVSVMAPLQLAASFQKTRETFLDGVTASNARVLISATYFF